MSQGDRNKHMSWLRKYNVNENTKREKRKMIIEQLNKANSLLGNSNYGFSNLSQTSNVKRRKLTPSERARVEKERKKLLKMLKELDN